MLGIEKCTAVRKSPESTGVASRGRCALVVFLTASFAACGCHREPEITFNRSTKPPAVRLLEPQERHIVRVVGQPSFVETYERTSIYPKPLAFIEKWNVDIGDKLKKDDVLATLFAPELVEELRTKQALVVVDRERIALAKEVVEVDKADVQAAEARLSEAEQILAKYQSEVDRWQTEVDRLERQVGRGVVDRRVLFESTNQLKSSTAMRDRAKATIKRARAELLAAEARLEKAKVDVRVAEAMLKVAESEEQYAAAWVGYLTITAPFPGIISARNTNTFDIVLPTTGDPTAFYLSPDIAPSGTAAPLFVVDRLDLVRIFVDVPEQDANFVGVGTKASVLAKAFRDREIPATVTRVAWALNQKSRTLRVEIDLPNPQSQLLPGMYAYVRLFIDRPHALAIPVDALELSNDQTFCWVYYAGKAVRIELETGASDDDWIQVTNRRPPKPPEDPPDKYPWTPIDGTEQVILGDLASLREGGPVEVVRESEPAKRTKNAPAPTRPRPQKATGSPRVAQAADSSGNVETPK